MKEFLKIKIEHLGKKIIESIKGFGKFISFLSKFFYWAPRPPYRRFLFFFQLHFIGNQSLFIICLTGSFTGMVMAYQTYLGFKMISADAIVGPIVSLTLAKELGPVLSGLIVAGRCGAAMAAQIGSMKVTEQIDALEVMGIDAFQYLAVPRIAATTLALPMLTTVFNLVGNLGSYLIGTKLLSIDEVVYFSKISDFMYMEDIFQGLIKSFFFGFIIACIGTYQGFHVTGGAEGVGKATNLAVVWGMVIVLVLDFFLTSLLVQVL